jgi:hypothetical protein
VYNVASKIPSENVFTSGFVRRPMKVMQISGRKNFDIVVFKQNKSAMP